MTGWPHPKRPKFGNRSFSINPKVKRVSPTGIPRIIGHALCPICNERYMAKDARCCSRCAPRDPELAELDRLIAEGRDKPRMTIAAYLRGDHVHGVKP